MAAADIAVQSSNYTGNVGLGGGVEEAIKIDTKPLEELSHYTFLYNKSENEENRKRAALNAKELADNTVYDLSTAIPKDRATIEKEYDTFINWTKENAHKLALSSDYNSALAIEYRSKKNKFNSLLNSAKVRNIMYKSRQQEYSSKDPAVAGEMQKSLDEEANNTDIYTPLKPSLDYDLAPVNVAPASVTSVDVVRKGDNQIAIRDYTIPNYGSAKNQAIAIVGGLIDSFPKEGTPEYDNLSEGAKNNIKEQRKLQGVSGKMQPVKDAETINSILNKTDAAGKKVYFNDDGSLNVEALTKGESGNGLFMRVMQQITAYNNGVNNIRKNIIDGEFQDKSGKKLAFGFGLNEADFQPIDLGKGSISPEELLTMKIIGKTQDVAYKTRIQETNEAISNTKNQIDREQLSETTRHNKATEAIEKQNADTQKAQVEATKEKWKATMSGGDTEKNGAMLRAQRIYNSLQKLADENGVISPDKIRQLNNEQRKYLGADKIVTDANSGTEKVVYTPLEVESGKHAIQLVNGEVKVLSGVGGKGGDEVEKSANGGYRGKWDNTKSTNLFNIATNILNEELRVAGAKELNSYMPLDAGTENGVSSATYGGGSSVSGGSSSSSGNKSSASESQTTPTYSRAELLKLGYTDDEINTAVSLGNVKIK